MSNKIYNDFKKPTPYKWRKIGYALLSASVALAGYLNLFTHIPYKEYIAGAVAITGVLGKVISDLAKEEPEK